MPKLQVIRPVVGRQVVIELPDDWGDIKAVEVTLSPHQDTPYEADSESSPLFQALEDIGFIGCIDSGEQLSTNYKQKLDFSDKCGKQR